LESLLGLEVSQRELLIYKVILGPKEDLYQKHQYLERLQEAQKVR
jgi:hypothetical protein